MEDRILPRILVIGDASLQRLLEVGFARGGAAEVSSASSVQGALVLAAVERPQLVVCAERNLEVGLLELWHALAKLDLQDTQLLCVQESVATETGDSGVRFCSEEELFETVASLLPAPAPSGGRAAVRLLASLERVGSRDSHGGPSLANLIELGARDLVLEAPLELELGQRLALGFFLPSDAEATANRISLTCAVDAVLDENCLHYRACFEYIDKSSRMALDRFLGEIRGDREER